MHANKLNAFFVANEYWHGDYAADKSELVRYWSEPVEPTHVFMAYDGTVILSRPLYSNWHRMSLHQSDIQILPNALHHYPDDYNVIERFLWSLIRVTRRLKGKG